MLKGDKIRPSVLAPWTRAYLVGGKVGRVRIFVFLCNIALPPSLLLRKASFLPLRPFVVLWGEASVGGRCSKKIAFALRGSVMDRAHHTRVAAAAERTNSQMELGAGEKQ